MRIFVDASQLLVSMVAAETIAVNLALLLAWLRLRLWVLGRPHPAMRNIHSSRYLRIISWSAWGSHFLADQSQREISE